MPWVHESSLVDGAANMMGNLRGLAKLFEADEASALPVHCFAHCACKKLQVSVAS